MNTTRNQATGGDTLAKVIPYKNPFALIGYYCGVFSVIPIAGFLLGPIALVLGILGLRARKQSGAAHGLAHALVGVIVGGLSTLVHYGLVVAAFMAH